MTKVKSNEYKVQVIKVQGMKIQGIRYKVNDKENLLQCKYKRIENRECNLSSMKYSIESI